MISVAEFMIGGSQNDFIAVDALYMAHNVVDVHEKIRIIA